MELVDIEVIPSHFNEKTNKSEYKTPVRLRLTRDYVSSFYSSSRYSVSAAFAVDLETGLPPNLFWGIFHKQLPADPALKISNLSQREIVGRTLRIELKQISEENIQVLSRRLDLCKGRRIGDDIFEFVPSSMDDCKTLSSSRITLRYIAVDGETNLIVTCLIQDRLGDWCSVSHPISTAQATTYFRPERLKNWKSMIMKGRDFIIQHQYALKQ